MPKREAAAKEAYANYLQAAIDAADQWRKQEVWFPSEFSCISRSRIMIPGDIESVPLRAASPILRVPREAYELRRLL
jgi:hypothetical protein